MNKKEELIQIRCSRSEKDQIKKAANKTGLSVANYVLKCLGKEEIIATLFDRVQDKIESLVDKVDMNFHYLKEDSELILGNQKKEMEGMILRDIINEIDDKSDLNFYKSGDLLTYKTGQVYIINYVDPEREIHVQSIETEKVGRLRVGSDDLISLLKDVNKIQRRR